MKMRVLLLTAVIGMTVLGACSDDSDSGSDSGSDSAATTAGDAAGANTTTGSGGGDASGEAAVVASDLAFAPGEITVSVGETITFTNSDGFAHTFTADNGEFDSDNVDSGGSFEYAPEAAGDIPFHCKIHTSMTGTITVEA